MLDTLLHQFLFLLEPIGFVWLCLLILTAALWWKRQRRFALASAFIVLVITASPHRAAALEAATFLMDFLKTRAPFWKKEHLRSGSTGWVAAKTGDDDAAERWK